MTREEFQNKVKPRVRDLYGDDWINVLYYEFMGLEKPVCRMCGDSFDVPMRIVEDKLKRTEEYKPPCYCFDAMHGKRL